MWYCFLFIQKKKLNITIKKGYHKGYFIFPRIIGSNRVSIKVVFNSDFWDETETIDTSKIFRISDSWHHHENSMGIGFRNHIEIKDYIEVRSLIYRDGERYIETIDSFHRSDKTPRKYDLIIEKDKYIFDFKNGFTQEFERTSKWFGPRYLLFPYYGGQKKANKDYSLTIKY